MSVATRTGISLSGVATVSGIAKAGIATIDGIAIGGGVADIPVDLWQDFETNTLDATNLSAQDHNSVGIWVVDNTSGSFSISNPAEEHLLSTISPSDGGGPFTDTGTRGLRRDYGATNGDTIEKDFQGGSFDNYSAGCWINISGAPTINKRLFTTLSAGGSDLCIIRYTSSNSFIGLEGGTDNGAAITLGTKFWLTWKVVRNGTILAKVLDVGGSIIGAEFSVAAPDAATRRFFFTNYNPQTIDAGVTVDFDDLLINSTTSPYPLGP